MKTATQPLWTIGDDYSSERDSHLVDEKVAGEEGGQHDQGRVVSLHLPHLLLLLHRVVQ